MRISDWSSDVCSSDLFPVTIQRVGTSRHSHQVKVLVDGALLVTTILEVVDECSDNRDTSNQVTGVFVYILPCGHLVEFTGVVETMCYLFYQQYNLPVSIARPFNNYGPGMKLNDQRVPADFAKALLN